MNAIKPVGSSEPLFTLTGNPFVDAGIAALSVLAKKGTPEDITIKDVRPQLDYIVDLYSHKDWKRVIHGMFFPNSELVNPSVKDGDERFKKTLQEYFEGLAPISGSGNCVACGRRDGIRANKTSVPLLGSNKLVNFFPAGIQGERFCVNCLLSVQFMLLSVEKVGIPLLIHTRNWVIQRAYAARNVDMIRLAASKKEYGIAEIGYTMTAGINAAYDAIQEIIQKKEVQAMPTGTLVAPVRFYHFTNFGQSPQMNFYDVPSQVIDFLIAVRVSGMIDDWRRVVRRGYVFRKKDAEEDKVRRTSPNRVYLALSEERPIIQYFFSEAYEVIGSWRLIELYLMRLRKMNKKRVDTIKEIADRILDFCQKKGSARRIRELHYARTYHQFRSILLKCQEEMVNTTGRPLLTLDQYLTDLAPEQSEGWREIRDLLLFRIYENGASWLSGQLPYEEENEE